jgi:hypothetical protein
MRFQGLNIYLQLCITVFGKNYNMPFLPRPQKKIVSNWANMDRKKFYSTTVWRKVREQQISTYPLCIACMANGTLTDCTAGGIVDHIVRIEAGGAPLDMRNFWTLCPPHSAKKTALESHGLEVESIGEVGSLIPTETGKRETLKRIA